DPGEIVTTTGESEVTVRPGGEVRLTVKVERRKGFKGRVPVDVQGLPHGVRVLDIGLNGILITEQETSRTVVIHAEPWVEPMAHPRLRSSRRSSDLPPRRPRRPRRRASSSAAHVSFGAASTGPESARGQEPVWRKWASAQARIWRTRRRGGPAGLPTPRRRAS